MGGSSSKDQELSCIVRNQLGRDVRLACRAEGQGNGGSPTYVFLEHGYEHEAKVPSASDGRMLIVALDFGSDDVPAYRIPTGAKLVLRKGQGGERVVRVLLPGEESWTSPTLDPNIAGQELFQLVGNSGTEPEASVEADPTSEDDISPALAPQAAHENGTTSTVAPADCTCPISHEAFIDPVLAADGFTYERECILEWWRRRGVRSPMTGQDLKSSVLTPNLAALALAQEHRQRLHAQAQALETSAPDVTASAASSPVAEECDRAPAGASANGLDDDMPFYERHLSALVEMFAPASKEDIVAACEGLHRQGIDDIDSCVRHLLQAFGGGGEAAVVSWNPVCCATDSAKAASPTAEATAAEQEKSSQEAPSAEELLVAEMIDIGIHPVRARKAASAGGVDDLDAAIAWLEKHQEDQDIDLPPEVIQQKALLDLSLTVLRVATVPAAHRLPCFKTLHSILGHILLDPTSLRRRQIRLHNSKFKEKVGRFPQALKLLRSIGFVQGDYWVSAFQREPCLEFRLPVDSDNPTSQKFVCAYSLIDEILREQERYLQSMSEAMEPVETTLASAQELAAVVQDGALAGAGPSQLPREFFADLHERRVRDPRGFQEAMRAAGRRGNPLVIDVRTPAPSHDAQNASSTGGAQQQTLLERMGGRRQVTMDDIERMRIEDAIANCPLYAEEYLRGSSTATSYGQLVSRMYDPQYLGRRAVDETNVFRGEQKLPPLHWSQAMADIAEEHAKQMARGEAPFSHQGFSERVDKFPFPHHSAAENLAYNGGVADAAGYAVQGWINSPGHRKNLLGSFNLCGVGVAQSAAGQFFFTQLFART